MLDEQKLDDLLAEWEERRQQGQESSAEELCRERPELLVALKERIHSLKATDWMFEADNDEDEASNTSLADILSRVADQELVLAPIPYETCVRSLTETGLVSMDELQRLEPASSATGAQSDGSVVLRQLLAQHKLTRHQAITIADGKAKSLVLGNYVILDKIVPVAWVRSSWPGIEE